MKLLKSKPRHSLFRRLSWNPLIAMIPTGLLVYRGLHRGFVTFDYVAISIGLLWIGLSFYDFFSNHRFINWIYSKDDKDEPSQQAQQPIEPDKESAERAQLWYDHKSELLERVLGKEHDMVGHSTIPYFLGGALDLYYFPNGLPGTAIATKELCEMPNEGPSNREYKSYELVMFTREPLSLDDSQNPSTPFGKAHRNMNLIYNHIARYSAEAQLSPGETCEFPKGMKDVGGKCLVFDGYAKFNDDLADDFGLMLLIEIHRSELDFAKANGPRALIEKLKEKGAFPYSDLDRDPVV